MSVRKRGKVPCPYKVPIHSYITQSGTASFLLFDKGPVPLRRANK